MHLLLGYANYVLSHRNTIMLSTSQNVHEISKSKVKRFELNDMTKETTKHGNKDLVQLFSDGLWFKVPVSGDCDENIITYIDISTNRDCLESWNGVLSWIVANFLNSISRVQKNWVKLICSYTFVLYFFY